MDNALNQPQFQDADKARAYLEAQVWPNGPVCPHCGVVDGHYKINGKSTRPGLYKCKDCYLPFTVTVGSLFERSKVPLNSWLLAVYLICSSKKGISSHQLHRTLGVTYKTAWFMSHRIRAAMKPNGGGLLGSSGSPVEADETFLGTKPGAVKRAGTGHKEAIFSLVERNGDVRSFHVPDVKADTLKAKLLANVDTKARLMTDKGGQYRRTKETFVNHEQVDHGAGEYVRGSVHTNTIEGFFSIFKRGIYGIYQHVSSHHLERYTTEFDFRYNHRKVSDAERADSALKGIRGKRLTYRPIDQAQ